MKYFCTLTKSMKAEPAGVDVMTKTADKKMEVLKKLEIEIS